MFKDLIHDSDKIAIRSRNQSISFRDLVRQVESLASTLNIDPGAHVALFADNSPNWIVCLYAVWYRGGVVVPIDYSAEPEDLAYMLQDSDPQMVLTDSNGLLKIQECLPGDSQPSFELIRIDPFPVSESSAVKHGSRESDTALILYTSGTTGKPKGVMLSFDNICFNINAVIQTEMLVAEDRILALFPFHHIVPLQGHILCPLFIGATVCFADELSAESILHSFKEYQITVLNGVPLLYERFHQRIFHKINESLFGRLVLIVARMVPWQSFRKNLFRRVHRAFGGKLRYMLSGGAALEKRIADDFWVLGFRMIEGYGMTEMGPLISYNTPREYRTGSVGKPVPGVEVRIEDGEVMARSPGVMQGYLNKADATNEILKDGWIRTGDLGEFDDAGFLILNGRKHDRIVLPSGKNITAEAVENRIIKDTELIADLALIERNGKLLAIIQADLDLAKQRGIKNIREAIKWDVLDQYNQSVPAYKRILDFVLTSQSLPRTRLGKLKRFQLNQVLAPKIDPVKNRQMHDDPIYNKLSAYLEKELKRSIQADAHFELDLGLDSLAFMDLKIFLEEEYGIQTDERLFIEYPTVSDLTVHIRQTRLDADTKSGAVSTLLTKRRHQQLKINRFLIYLSRVLVYPVSIFYYRIKKQGMKALPQFMRERGNFILAPNHQSFLDPFILSMALPIDVLRNTFFLAKKKHFNFPLGNFFKNNLNTIISDIHTESDLVVDKIVSVLEQGRNIVIFPEGTRSFSGKLGHFNQTYARIAKDLKIPVFPVGIRGTFRLLSRTQKFPKPGKVEIQVFDRIEPFDIDAGQIHQQTVALLKKYVEDSNEYS